MPSCSSKKRKKRSHCHLEKKVFFSPARKLGGLHRVVTAPDRCLCIRIQQKFCLDCFHEYLIMVVTAARRMTTLGQLWDNFGTTLGPLWDDSGTTLGRLWDKFECFSLLLPGGNRDENDEQEDKGASTTSTHHLQ